MSQWGMGRFYRHRNGAAIFAMPHVNTGTAFTPAKGSDLVGDIMLMEIFSGSTEEVDAAKAHLDDRYKGKPYREWLMLPDFPKGGTVLTRDHRIIDRIRGDDNVLWGDFMGFRFEAYDETSGKGVEPWIAMIRGDMIAKRIPASKLEIFYKGENDDGSNAKDDGPYTKGRPEAETT